MSLKQRRNNDLSLSFPASAYKSAEFVNSSEDNSTSEEEEEEEVGSVSTPHHHHSKQSPPLGGRGHSKQSPPLGGRGPLDGDVGACVRELYERGHGEDLQWLEAYLLDEARDRTLDGECVLSQHTKW